MECRTLYNPKSLNNLYGGRPVLMHKLLLPLESLLAAFEKALYVVYMEWEIVQCVLIMCLAAVRNIL